MAENDILPYDSVTGGHCRVRHFPLAASETFLRGEPVGLTSAGQLNEPGTLPDSHQLLQVLCVC